MHMTTDSFIFNPCDDEEDDMALVCCHGDNGDLFLLGRFPDEDEVDITFRDDTIHVEQLKVTLSATLLRVEIDATDAQPFGGDTTYEITHATPERELGDLDETLRILLKDVGSYVSDLT
jgi:hydrogenase maturation factor